MPSRIIREGINTSSRVNALSPGAELFYRRLLTVVDDYGRYYAAPATLRGALWPTCPTKVCDQDVSTWLAECSQHADNCQTDDRQLTVVYRGLDGNEYLQVVNFNQRIRSKSKFPDPPSLNGHAVNCQADDGQLTSTSRLSSDVLRIAYCVSRQETGNTTSTVSAEIAGQDDGLTDSPFLIPKKTLDEPAASQPGEILTTGRLEFMRDALMSYMAMSGTVHQRQVPPPPDAVLLQCLQAVGNAPPEQINRVLHSKFAGLDASGRETLPPRSPRDPGGPKSYAWFPAVLREAFGA